MTIFSLGSLNKPGFQPPRNARCLGFRLSRIFRVFPLHPGPSRQPFPVTAVPGPENILGPGSLKAVDQVVFAPFYLTFHGPGKGFQADEGRPAQAFDPGDGQALFPMAVPLSGQNVNVVALTGQTAGQLTDIQLGPAKNR